MPASQAVKTRMRAAAIGGTLARGRAREQLGELRAASPDLKGPLGTSAAGGSEAGRDCRVPQHFEQGVSGGPWIAGLEEAAAGSVHDPQGAGGGWRDDGPATCQRLDQHQAERL